MDPGIYRGNNAFQGKSTLNRTGEVGPKSKEESKTLIIKSTPFIGKYKRDSTFSRFPNLTTSPT